MNLKQLALFFALFSCVFLSAQFEVELLPFADGFNLPVDIQHHGTEDLYIVEKRGMIKIVNAAGEVNETDFLNIRSIVRSNGNEQGLLGLEFHPNYNENGRFFVNYTRQTDGATVISSFQVSEDPAIADPASEEVIMVIGQTFSNHNGGDLAFGPDGYLYIGTGDGGSGGDPNDAGQNPMDFLGKMLRIDVDCDQPYCIPADNPFADDDFTLDEIWATGLRNPWRYSFDRQTGDLWIADVGQNAREEIDFQAADSKGGENYGWRCYEGDAEFNLSGCNQSDYVFPIYDYLHDSGDGCSVTGGYVYRGAEYPFMDGYYIYGDFCTGNIWALNQEGSNNLVASYFGGEVGAFGEDANGELYMAAYGRGEILKIEAISLSIGEPVVASLELSSTIFSDQLNVRAQDTDRVDFTISDVNGLEHAKGYLEQNSSSINTATWAPGLYFVRWRSGHRSGLIKCVKQ